MSLILLKNSLVATAVFLAGGCTVFSALDYMSAVTDPGKIEEEQSALNIEKLCQQNPSVKLRMGFEPTCSEIFNIAYVPMDDRKLYELFVLKVMHNTPADFQRWMSDFKAKDDGGFKEFQKKAGAQYQRDSSRETPRQSANLKLFFG